MTKNPGDLDRLRSANGSVLHQRNPGTRGAIMDNPYEIIDLQLKAQQVIDLVRGGQSGPHILHEFIDSLPSGDERKVALRLVQKSLEQKK